MFQETQDDQDLGLQELIETRDPAVDVETVMRQIQAKIRRRGMEAGGEGIKVEVENFPFGEDTNHNLRRLRSNYNNIGVNLILTDSRVPVVGALWQKVRRSLHHLVLFYVNTVARNQVGFNKYVVWTFVSLLRHLAQENEQMRAEVKRLQARVAALEVGCQVAPEHRERE